uniref:Uncharacterized protein n=1 Tax=Steinernema glaseri TaxID=37863 RepID=A0A1I7ZLF7_9BILA
MYPSAVEAKNGCSLRRVPRLPIGFPLTPTTASDVLCSRPHVSRITSSSSPFKGDAHRLRVVRSKNGQIAVAVNCVVPGSQPPVSSRASHLAVSQHFANLRNTGSAINRSEQRLHNGHTVAKVPVESEREREKERQNGRKVAEREERRILGRQVADGKYNRLQGCQARKKRGNSKAPGAFRHKKCNKKISTSEIVDLCSPRPSDLEFLAKRPHKKPYDRHHYSPEI